jgi:hypothetical protein
MDVVKELRKFTDMYGYSISQRKSISSGNFFHEASPQSSVWSKNNCSERPNRTLGVIGEIMRGFLIHSSLPLPG